MEIPVIVEPTATGYRARCARPVYAEADGETRLEATRALEAILAPHVPGPVELLPLEVSADWPWVAPAGSVPDDAVTEQWLGAIAEYRRERDAEDRASLPAPAAQPAP